VESKLTTPLAIYYILTHPKSYLLDFIAVFSPANSGTVLAVSRLNSNNGTWEKKEK